MKLKWATVALLAALFAPAPAAAEWTKEQLTEFMTDCIHSCQNENASVTAAKRGRCPDYCRCVADAGQRRFSAADYAEMNADSMAKRDTPKLRVFGSLFQPCMAGTIQ